MKKLLLRSDLFPDDVIDEGVNAYAALATIEVSRVEGYRICIFRGCAYDEDLTVMEFENYLIDLLNCRMP